MQLPSLESGDVLHLRERGYAHRRRYERPDLFPCEPIPAKDHPYLSRDHLEENEATRNVSEITNLLRIQPSRIHTTKHLAKALQQTSFIQGYVSTFSNPFLSDLLEADIGLQWGPLVNLCRRSERESRDSLMFQLGVMAFGKNVNMTLLRTIAAFFLVEELRVLNLPAYAAYIDFQRGQQPTLDGLVSLIRPCCRAFIVNTESDNACPVKRLRGIDPAKEEYEQRCDKECEDLALILLRQWPCPEPTIEDFSARAIDITKVQEAIGQEWRRLFQNWEFSQHLTEVQEVLNRHKTKTNFVSSTTRPKQTPLLPIPDRKSVIPTLSHDLLRKEGLSPTAGRGILDDSRITNPTSELLHEEFSNETVPISAPSPAIEELKTIVDTMISSPSSIRRQYGEDLKESLVALQKLQRLERLPRHIPPISDLSSRIAEAQQTMKDQFQAICDAFAAGDARHVWLDAGNLWPCLTPVTLLEQLRTTARRWINPHMKESLIAYAVSVTRVQHLLRIEDAQRKEDARRLHQERTNPGHGNWKPREYPDWILLEIGANMLIRDDQVDVAPATISPASGSNSVLQMNMGQGKRSNRTCTEREGTDAFQGKTSVIMPMVACVLANGKNLARLIVPKALLTQTAQIIQSRLGGLVGREIRHIPFSRKRSSSCDTTHAYESLHEEFLHQSGIILTLPDHVLSFISADSNVCCA